MQNKITFEIVGLEALNEVIQVVYKQAEEFNYNYNKKDTKVVIRNLLKAEYPMFVAKCDNKIVGVAFFPVIPTWYNWKEQTATELLWYVLPEYRKGTGGKLLKFVENYFSNDILEIGIASAEKTLIKYLERQGYSSYKTILRKG